MKHDIATKWVEALRSGKYQQTTDKLKDDKGYCCLGVLCDVLGLEFEHNYEEDPDTGYLTETISEEYPYAIDGVPDNLSVRARERSDIWDPNGTPRGWKEGDTPQVLGQRSLAQANDHGATFKQIADFIEQNWERL